MKLELAESATISGKLISVDVTKGSSGINAEYGYYMIYFSQVSTFVRFLSAIVFGTFQALTLIHVMHDACHSAIGYNELWWKVIGRFSMDFISGGDMKHWHYQHVLGHHIYTNVMGADPDLPELLEGDMRYIVPRQVWKSIYKYQYIYMPILYGLLSIKVRLQNWTTTYLTLKNGPVRVNPISTLQWVYFIFARCVNLTYELLIPMMFGNQNWIRVLGFWCLQEVALGFWLAFNFQVSHISTVATFPNEKRHNPAIEGEWAVLQVLSSVDYSHKSSVATFLSGALNYQTTHHLFPCVSQYHYPSITPIIMDVCKKWDVPFNHLPSFHQAFGAHLDLLYSMGNPASAGGGGVVGGIKKVAKTPKKHSGFS
eukprot:TRINITY_DN5832_c0_g1_i10.p1 TRINITY_DN5832_c0_g1~~TRINITY_DN5832_c0_g1_i10.p1  ORF type:complete len:369 (-),score=83.08 TRINITY_DN5832_c0_g1_i10:111-1217(-)